MTDLDKSAEDSASEGFLERWSRKKIDATEETKAESELAKPSLPEQHTDDAPGTPLGTAAKAEFDLSSLPSLDSITAATDIRAFLAPGVPKELARAALRRAWAADPAIRDFVGLAENDWDFTNPNAMPGFGALPEGYDVKKLVAQILGERDSQPDAEQAATAQSSQMAAKSVEAAAPAQAAPQTDNRNPPATEPPSDPSTQMAQADFVQRDNIIAAHQSIESDEPAQPETRRQHGSALPQ